MTSTAKDKQVKRVLSLSTSGTTPQGQKFTISENSFGRKIYEKSAAGEIENTYNVKLKKNLQAEKERIQEMMKQEKDFVEI